MTDIDPSRRTKILMRVVPLIPLLLFIISFWGEMWTALRFLRDMLIPGQPGWPPEAETSRALGVMLYGLGIGALTTFVLWAGLFSAQALLPVHSLEDTLKTAWRLVLYILGMHGPAIFIRDGQIRATRKELREPRQGVAVVDFNSALVLERTFPPGWKEGGLKGKNGLFERLLKTAGMPKKPKEPVRVCGPGLVFLEPDERIHGVGDLSGNDEIIENLSGVVDLRLQFRKSGENGKGKPERNKASVHAYTRDGIEVGTNITTLFTIGQNVNAAPHVLQVTYDGEIHPDTLRVVTLEEQDNPLLVKSLKDELDLEDRQEIFRQTRAQAKQRNIGRYQRLPVASRQPTFDPERVFAAVYSKARDRSPTERVLPWTETPVRVGVDLFREMISQVNFDELYQPVAGGLLKIDELRRDFRTRMRNAGLLSYRLVLAAGKEPLVPGKRYFPHSLLAGRVLALGTSKMLRDRGVQVMAANFGELLPEKEIYRQWLSTWRAEWERATVHKQAIADLEARRVYNRSRAQALQEMTLNLRQIYEDDRMPKEAVALRLLQSLEMTATDPQTRSLLPEETIKLLENLHDWLLPEEREGKR